MNVETHEPRRRGCHITILQEGYARWKITTLHDEDKDVQWAVDKQAAESKAEVQFLEWAAKEIRVSRDQPLHAEWLTSVMVIWWEDDVNYPDKERVDTAFRRITRLEPDNYVDKVDAGDALYYLYQHGWVRCVAVDGGYVGCVVKCELRRPW